MSRYSYAISCPILYTQADPVPVFYSTRYVKKLQMTHLSPQNLPETDVDSSDGRNSLVVGCALELDDECSVPTARALELDDERSVPTAHDEDDDACTEARDACHACLFQARSW